MAVCKARDHNINVIGALDRLFSSPFYIATKHPELRPYMTAVERMMRWRSDLTHEFTRPLQLQQRLSKKDKRTLHRALEYIDAVGMEPKAAPSYTFKVEGTRPGGAPLDLVGSKEGDTITLTGDVATAFTELRRTVNSFYTHMIRSSKAALGYDPDAEISTIEDPEERALIESMENSRRQGYMPRMRVGDVGFHVNFPDGRRHFYVAEPQGTDRIKIGRSRIDAAVKEAKKIQADLKTRYSLDDSAFEPVKTMEVSNILEEVTKGNIDSFEALLTAMMSPKLMKELGVEGDKSPLKELIQRVKTAQKAQSFQRTQIRRKDIPGYLHGANFDNYFESALNAYLLRGADFLGAQYTAAERSKAINDLYSTKGDQNVNLGNWARDHSAALAEPQSLAWMKGVAFHWALGMNVSSAAINLTQNLHTTFPYLTMMAANPLKSSSLIVGAFKDTARLFDRTSLSKLDPDQLLDMDRARKVLSADEFKFIELLTKTGTIRPLMTEELADNNGRVSYGSAYDSLSPYLRKAMNVSTMMFSGVEQANRLTAALAAYRLYKSDPKAMERAVKWRNENSIYSAEEVTPENLARLAVEDTQFVITRENRAKFMQGDIASVAFQFQQYPMMMLELMRKSLRFSDKKMASTMMGFMALGIMATTGAWGLPFAIPLKKLVEGTSNLASPYLGTNPVSLDAPMRSVGIEIGRLLGSEDPKYIGDYFANGFTRALGIDTAKRTALEIIPTEMFSGNAMDAAGPFAGLIIGGIVQANQYYNAGYPHLALASLLPLAARNAAQAAGRIVNDSQNEGFISPSTGASRIPAGTATSGEIFARGIGFTPARFAQLSEYAQAVGSQPTQLRRISVQNQLAQALLSSTLAQTPESREYHMERFNEILDRVVAADREQTDERQRIILDQNDFAKGIEDRYKRSLEGPLGEEAMKTKGNKTVREINRFNLNNIMPVQS